MLFAIRTWRLPCAGIKCNDSAVNLPFVHAMFAYSVAETTFEERIGMAKSRWVSAILGAGVIAAGITAGTAWAGGPGGYVEDPEDIFAAVGTGEFVDTIAGFTATGDTSEEASAAVIAACQSAGGVECTADEVTNDNLCIVSVASDSNHVVAGGAGATVEAARQDAFNKAAANNTPLDADSPVVVSACP
ncbi:DUF4189 domain-containing protein [Mycolicibacterium boenickei]|nr:DUF4189 domain-containing protein [Mycolicibacterium boenickei]